MPENTDMKYYEGMVQGVEGVGSAASAIGKRATGRASSDPNTPLTPKTSARRGARKQPAPTPPSPRTPRTPTPGGRTRRKQPTPDTPRRRKTSDADKKAFTDLEQGADIKRKAAEVRKKKKPENQSLRPKKRPENLTSRRPKIRPEVRPKVRPS